MRRVDKPQIHAASDQKSGRRRWGRAQRNDILDPYKAVAKPPEPTVCPQCGAIFRQGRWQWMDPPPGAHEMLCQACRRINDHYPAGVLTLTGTCVGQHRDEILQVARHQEEAERPEHPLNRIMEIEDEVPDRLAISTTDIHLPRRIGEAVARAYHGEVTEQFSENEYFVRVNWHRDE